VRLQSWGGWLSSSSVGRWGVAAVFMILPGAEFDVLVTCSKQTRSRLSVAGAWRWGMVGSQVGGIVELAT